MVITMRAVIGLDFGGSSTEIYVKGKGIVLREPSVAAVDAVGNVIAVGAEAMLIRGRAPGSVTIRRPIRDSVISDFNLTAEMLDKFIETAVPGGRKKVFVAVKCGVGEKDRQLIRSALADCRTFGCEFVEAPRAALAGSGYTDEGGVLVCDIGAGSVECSYLRDGGILRTETYFGGGRDADKAICAYLRRRYGLAVTKIAASDAKHKLDLTKDDPEPITLLGLDTSTGLPKRRQVSAPELLRSCAPQIKGALDCVMAVRQNLPRYAGVESTAERVILVGGGAALPGIAEYIESEVGIPTVAVEAPMDCAARGLGKLIEGV